MELFLLIFFPLNVFFFIDLGRAMFIVCLVVYLSISASFDCSPDRNKVIKRFKRTVL